MPDADPQAYLTNRMIALEERLTFAEQHIEQLNEVLLAHRQEIDQLQRQLLQSRAAVDLLAESIESEDLRHEKPPHY